MGWRLIVVTALLFAAAGLAAVVFAQLSGTQTASGTVNVTTTSAELYICEPDSTPGPDCGSDDSGADETVFETLEDMLPGGTAEWDIRLKNEGSETWMVSAATVDIVETVDPGDDCPDDALQVADIGFGPSALTILGKDSDPVNDNPHMPAGFPAFPIMNIQDSTQFYGIQVAPADYEDVRLRLQLEGAGTENCDGNEWNVSWELTVLPVSEFTPTPTPTTPTPTPEFCDPVSPTTFTGNVTIDGMPAPDGTVISAIGSDGITWATATSSEGIYTMDVPATQPVTPPCFPGGTISFHCDSLFDAWADETGQATGGQQELDLHCSTPSTPVAPPP